MTPQLHIHLGDIEGSTLLLFVVFIASLGTGALFLVSLIAYRRRSGTQYLLICVAVGALFARSIVGAGTILGYTPMTVHHLVEHSFDFFIASIVLYAVYSHAPGSFSGLSDADGDREQSP